MKTKKKILIFSVITVLILTAIATLAYSTKAEELKSKSIDTRPLVGEVDPTYSSDDQAAFADDDYSEDSGESETPAAPTEPDPLEEEGLASYGGSVTLDEKYASSCPSVETVTEYINNQYNNSTDGGSAETIMEKGTLYKYINAFCLKHNKGMSGAGSPFVYPSQHYFALNMNTYIDFNKDTPWGTAPSFKAGTPEKWVDRCQHTSPESHARSASNFNCVAYRVGQNLKSTEAYNYYGRVNPSYNVIPYAVTFNDRTSTSQKYNKTKAQNAVWQDVGDTVGENEMYKAAKAIDDFEAEALRLGVVGRDGSNDIDYKQILPKITVGANAGTTISNDESTFRVGPFTMSDFAYAYSENVKNYSGKDVAQYKGLVGGIDEMTLYFKGDDGSSKSLKISDGVAKIVYNDWYGRTTAKGDAKRNTGSYTTTIPDSEDIFPAPKSTFYIDIPRSALGENITILRSIKTSYRVTKVAGKGDVYITRYATTSWTITDEGTHNVDTYYHRGGGSGCSTTHSGGHVTTSVGSRSCTHTWYTGCWTTYHTGSYTDSNGNSHTYTYSVHHHGTHHSQTYTNFNDWTCRHGFTYCCEESWRGSLSTGLGQPILIGVGNVAVIDYRPVTYCNIRLTTAIKVKKYIEEIKHETNNYVTFGDNTTGANAALEATQKPADRFKMTDAEKAADPTYAEFGDIITYRIDIINEQKAGVNIKLLDTLPDNIVVINREFYDNQWLRIPGGALQADHVAASYRITVRTEANDDAVYVNDVEIITKNLSIAKNSSTNVNFIRTRDSRHGPVVNIKELGTGKTVNLNSKDYFKINDYSISVDKYLSKYFQEMTIQNNNNDFTDESYVLEDRSNKDDSYKSTKPFPVEKGETFTYTINLLNTSVKGTGNKVATQVRPSETIDTLDEGLEIIRMVGYIKKSDGSIKKTLGDTDYSRAGGVNGVSKITVANKSGNDYLILDPTEYFSYEITVKVTKTNMFLGSLQNKADISILSNINNGVRSTEATINCATCNGSGKQISRTICNYCGGAGTADTSTVCQYCRNEKTCETCHGTGKIQLVCSHIETGKTYKCTSCDYDYAERPAICTMLKTDDDGNTTTGECGSTAFTYVCSTHDNVPISSCSHFEAICDVCGGTVPLGATICPGTKECTSTDVTVKCRECGKNPTECTHFKYVCADCSHESTTAVTSCSGEVNCGGELESTNNTEKPNEKKCKTCGTTTEGSETTCLHKVTCGSTKICKICTMCSKELVTDHMSLSCATCGGEIGNDGNCATADCDTKAKITCEYCGKTGTYGEDSTNNIDLITYEITCRTCGKTHYSSETTPYCGAELECGSTSITTKCTSCNKSVAECTDTAKKCASCGGSVAKTATKCTNTVEQKCNSTTFTEICQKCGAATSGNGSIDSTCTTCSGRGKTSMATGDANTCSYCEGHGTIATKGTCTHCSGNGVTVTETECSGCNGTGTAMDTSTGDRIVRTADGSINRNTNTRESSSEFVKLKDLVIAGKVWLDRDKDGLMGARGNGELEVGANAIKVENNPSTYISDTTGKEYAMEGITVKLYTSDGTLVRTTKTNENGLFTFGKDINGSFYAGEYSRGDNGVVESAQRIAKGKDKDENLNYTSEVYMSYYVEYEYDGLVYKSTELYAGSENLNTDGSIKEGGKYLRDSNAYEFSAVRDAFNLKYEIVSFNKATRGDLSDEQTLEYDKQNHNSYICENNERKMTSRSFIDIPTQTTNNLWLYGVQSTEKPETEYLKYINLGLEEREDIDIDLVQDVYELKTTVNGEQMTYEYNQNNYALKVGEVFADETKNVEKAIDKAQEMDDNGESSNSKSFNSERFITGYNNDTGSVEQNKNLYKFEYYLEDYNYRVSQYHIDTVRAYKGSASRNYEADATTTGVNSVLLANSVGRESELNTEITFRIKVTNNSIPNDEPFHTDKDRKVYAGINEIVEYYDTDFIDVFVDSSDTIGSFNIKTKDANDYLVNTELKVLNAKAVLKDGSEQAVTLSATSPYNTERHLSKDGKKQYDTLYIRPVIAGNVLETNSNESIGQVIRAGDFILGEGESLDILITFVVEKELDAKSSKEIQTILGAKENVAEISAYSTYYSTGSGYKAASLIDRNSNPNNFGETYGGVSDVDSAEYIKYIEDDTFKTGINLSKPSDDGGPDEKTKELYKDTVQRTLDGFVWDDARTNTATDNKGTQYIGDGKFEPSITARPEARKNRAFATFDTKGKEIKNEENKDFKVQDVKAELIEVIRMPDPVNAGIERVYEDTIYVNGETGDNPSIMKMRTDSLGNYHFRGYIPGEYIVRFTYGDKESGENINSISDNRLIFNGQDYKSTSYQTQESTYAENAVGAGDKTPGDVKLEILEKTGNSDAKDDEIRRLEVISYSETMNNERNEILKGKETTSKDLLLGNTYMTADTTDFLVRPEKEIRKVKILTYKDVSEKVNKATKVAQQVTTTTTITEVDSRFAIHHIDFGLQYRPELQLALNKYISEITVTTSDSSSANTTEPLIDAIFNEYYGVVSDTNMQTGATSFISDSEGKVIPVDPNASDSSIAGVISSAGGDISKAQKDADGSYTIAIAGTVLDEDKSVGLQNVQYLPNEYKKDSNNNLDVQFENGKYRVQATQGFAYIVVDDEIMQGATIKVKYLFSGTNISEIDRVSENLSKLRFKENYEAQEKYSKSTDSADLYYKEETYQIAVENNAARPSFFNEEYSAARTARNALFSEFYRYELEGATVKKDSLARDIRYRIKPKDLIVNNKVVEIPNINEKTQSSGTPHTGNTGYYGRYLGSTYYTGTINANKEVIAEIKLDKILDYIDNDLVFNNDDNRADNQLWKTTTTDELYKGGMLSRSTYKYYNASGSIVDMSDATATTRKLVDAKGRAYDTAERSNLALSLDDRVRDDYGVYRTSTNNDEDPTKNAEFSKFLLPRASESLRSFGTISLTAAKVLSPEDETDDMVYENIAEVIQYTSVTGRITNLATTIGNAKIENITNESPEFREGRTESDTASVEKVTLTPPTGLSKVDTIVKNVVESASYTVFIVIGVALVCVIVMVSINIYHSKRRIK